MKLTVAKSLPKKRPQTRKKRVGANKSISYYKKKLDQVFSLYIRTRDKGKCYTCPYQNEIKKMQAGHFVPRQYLEVRWDERNVHAQCYACNVIFHGQPSAYALHLTLDYGRDIVSELELKRKVLTKLKPDWYLAQIEFYQNKLKEL